MALSWRDELKLRLMALEKVCRSGSAFNALDIKDGILGMYSSLEAGLKAWLRENDHALQEDKERARQQNCRFKDLLEFVQKYCDLDDDSRMTVNRFHVLRNDVQHHGHTPLLGEVRGYLPAFGKLLECLGVDVSLPERPDPPVGGKYAALSQYLAGLPAEQKRIALNFALVESIQGRPLPPSAYKHREWWSNHSHNSQARGWLSVGWRVDGVNLESRTVVLRRS